MKSKYFSSRTQPSQLRGTREKVVPKQTNWDRIVYMILLLALVLFLGYYLATSTFYITGDGRVVTEQMLIRAPGDIQIDEYYTSPNASVARGDTLFSFSFLNWQQENEVRQDASDQIEKINLEIDSASDKIILKQQDIDVTKSRIEYLEDLQQNFRERIRLDVATSLELTEVSQNLFNANAQLQISQTELTVLINSRNRHITRRQTVEQQLQHFLEGKGSEYFISPASGTLKSIQIRENHQAFRTDEILSIQSSDSDVYIFSLFKRKNAKHLASGTVMNVRFDNGDESTGIIRRTYDPRENLMNQINQAAELHNEYMVVELEPSDHRTRTQWLQMDRSGTEVYKSLWTRTKDRNQPEHNPVTEPKFETGSTTVSNHESSDPDAIHPAGGSDKENEYPNEQSEISAEINDDPQRSDYGIYGALYNHNLIGYSIIVGSLDDAEKAKETARRLKEEGYRAAVVPAVVNGKQYHRIALGQFETESSAIEAATLISSNLVTDYYIRKMN